MSRWRLMHRREAEQDWDLLLCAFPGVTIYQSYAWGEFHRRNGWTPRHWVAVDQSGTPVAMLLGMERRYLNVAVILSYGGPTGDLAAFGAELHDAIVDALGVSRLYCRFASSRPYLSHDALALYSNGWKRGPHAPPGFSGLSMTLDLDRDLDEVLAGLSRNWRHNLKRAWKRDLRIEQWHAPDPAEVLELYRRMEDFKGVRAALPQGELERLMTAFEKQIALYRCLDPDGRTVSLRGCLVFDSSGIDMFAATSPAGRKNYSSYGVFWELMHECVRRGVKHYDLNGVDPIRNPGVANFKKGTGAEFVEYLGYWDWATSERLRRGVNLASLSRDRSRDFFAEVGARRTR